MSSIASFLMVAAGSLCLIGAVAAKGRLTVAAAVVMVLAMVDMAYTALVPPVIWSGALLSLGVCLAVALRSSTRNPTPRRSSALVASGAGGGVEARGWLESGDLRGIGGGLETGGGRVTENVDSGRTTVPPDFRRDRAMSHSGPPAAILSAITYPVMAWQVLNHGAHMSGSDHHGGAGHGHHAGDMSLISTFLTAAVVVLAVCLVICAVHDIIRRRPLVSLDCWGMGAMILVMQFVH